MIDTEMDGKGESLPMAISIAEKARYREAGKSQNTHDTYLAAIRHFRDTWGGLLPASPRSISDYLVRYASEVKVSTTRVRLAALSKWHVSQGLYDPARAPEVKEVLRGIAKLHTQQQRQATPITFDHLKAIFERLEEDKVRAIREDDQAEILRTHRDLALVLVGFWQGFRSDELSRIAVENVRLHPGGGMSVFLPHSKTDTAARGRGYELPSLAAYCPVDAFQRWIEVSGIKHGPAFRSISRWGKVSDEGINKRSIGYILNRAADGLFPDDPKFSTHSLRRGFADWATRMGWDMKSLMEHVGWRSVASASRYLPTRKNFGELALDNRPALPRGGPAGAVIPGAAGRSLDLTDEL